METANLEWCCEMAKKKLKNHRGTRSLFINIPILCDFGRCV